MRARITASYGRPATVNGLPTPYLYGSGYGEDESLTRAADRAAELLVEAFGLPVEKRGNSDGKSTGAFHDEQHAWTAEDGVSSTWFGLGASEGNPISYSALFRAPVEQVAEMQANIPDLRERWGGRPYAPAKLTQVYMPGFATLEDALAWLKLWGRKYCPKLREG